MRDRAPIPAPIVTSPTHCLSHTRWRHSCLQCNAEESAQLSSAPRGGRQPDRHLLLLQTSAGSSSSRKRCARHTMSIAVCVRVSRQYSMRMCLLPALCRLHLLPPTAYPLPLTVCCLPLTAAVCRQLPTLATYRLPPATCACAYRLCCICTAYRLHTFMYPFLRSRSVRDGRARPRPARAQMSGAATQNHTTASASRAAHGVGEAVRPRRMVRPSLGSLTCLC